MLGSSIPHNHGSDDNHAEHKYHDPYSLKHCLKVVVNHSFPLLSRIMLIAIFIVFATSPRSGARHLSRFPVANQGVERRLCSILVAMSFSRLSCCTSIGTLFRLAMKFQR